MVEKLGHEGGKAPEAALRRHEGEFAWEGVERLPYKESDAALFKGISRQILFSQAGMAGELRYFEIEPGGFSTLERHAHLHGVMIIRGSGRCLVGTQVQEIGPFDLITIPAWTWHQFRTAPGEALGFLCLVDAIRDKPALPTPDELAALKAVPEIAAFLRS
jgi:quercetin dioxygenase-like cupin family protein